MSTFRTPTNPLQEFASKEKFTKPSITVPDQALSLKDLIDRHSRGQNTATFNSQFTNPVVEELDFQRQWERLDPIDKIEAARELTQQLKKRKEEFDNARKAAEEAKKQEYINWLVEQEKAKTKEVPNV